MAVLTGEGAGLVLSARTGLCHQPPRSTCIPGPQAFVWAHPEPKPQTSEDRRELQCGGARWGEGT